MNRLGGAALPWVRHVPYAGPVDTGLAEKSFLRVIVRFPVGWIDGLVVIGVDGEAVGKSPSGATDGLVSCPPVRRVVDAEIFWVNDLEVDRVVLNAAADADVPYEHHGIVDDDGVAVVESSAHGFQATVGRN